MLTPVMFLTLTVPLPEKEIADAAELTSYPSASYVPAEQLNCPVKVAFPRAITVAPEQVKFVPEIGPLIRIVMPVPDIDNAPFVESCDNVISLVEEELNVTPAPVIVRLKGCAVVITPVPVQYTVVVAVHVEPRIASEPLLTDTPPLDTVCKLCVPFEKVIEPEPV